LNNNWRLIKVKEPPVSCTAIAEWRLREPKWSAVMIKTVHMNGSIYRAFGQKEKLFQKANGTAKTVKRKSYKQ
jgi:hypothetical protein